MLLCQACANVGHRCSTSEVWARQLCAFCAGCPACCQRSAALLQDTFKWSHVFERALANSIQWGRRLADLRPPPHRWFAGRPSCVICRRHLPGLLNFQTSVLVGMCRLSRSGPSKPKLGVSSCKLRPHSVIMAQSAVACEVAIFSIACFAWSTNLQQGPANSHIQVPKCPQRVDARYLHLSK